MSRTMERRLKKKQKQKQERKPVMTEAVEVRRAENVPAGLQRKREALIAEHAARDQERRDVAFSAHAEADAPHNAGSTTLRPPPRAMRHR
jgi:hypothetical protein